MAHMLDMTGGKANMAYRQNGGAPWHKLGVALPDDVTPDQMLEAAGLNWDVELYPLYAEIEGKKVYSSDSALVRTDTNEILDTVSDNWCPTNNSVAFEFFNEFVAAGQMQMETAGSLKGGKMVWAMAKANDSFALFNGKDQIDSYLLFSNPHQYGKCIDIRMVQTRVVCNNTISIALKEKSKNIVRVNHRNEFDAEKVKALLGLSHDRLGDFKEAAEFLSKKKAKDEDIVEFFTRIFPVTGANTRQKEIGKMAQVCLDAVDDQPGAEFGKGSWWHMFNTVTYAVDHLAGRNDATRLESAWYGQGATKKNDAIKLALEMAK